MEYARPTNRKGSRRILRPVLGRFGSRMTIPAVVAALNRRLNSGIPSGMLLNPLNCQPSILIGAGGDGDREGMGTEHLRGAGAVRI